MRKSPVLSVVITTLNAGPDKLERAIRSVIEQDYEHKNLIIIDGGSTDGCVDVIKNWNDKIYYWVSEPDNGVADAGMKGTLRAPDGLVGYLGADDWYYPGAFEAVAKVYEETSADVLYGDVELENAKKELHILRCNDVKLDELYWHSPFLTIGTFVKNKLPPEALKDYAPKIASDSYMWGKLHHLGYKFQYVDAGFPLAHFSYGGISRTRLKETYGDARKAYFKLIEDSDELKRKYTRPINRQYALAVYPHYRDVISNRELERGWENVLSPLSPVIIFGSGKNGKEFLEILKKHDKQVKYFISNHETSFGKCIDGVFVRSPECLPAETNATIVITPHAAEEIIWNQLNSMKLDPSVKVVYYAELIYRVIVPFDETLIQEEQNSYREG